MRFEVSTLSGPDFTNAKTYKSFNHRQGAKNRKEEFFTRHARPRRRLGRSARNRRGRRDERRAPCEFDF
jgi:hypothetical protein